MEIFKRCLFVVSLRSTVVNRTKSEHFITSTSEAWIYFSLDSLEYTGIKVVYLQNWGSLLSICTPRTLIQICSSKPYVRFWRVVRSYRELERTICTNTSAFSGMMIAFFTRSRFYYHIGVIWLLLHLGQQLGLLHPKGPYPESHSPKCHTSFPNLVITMQEHEYHNRSDSNHSLQSTRNCACW